MTSVLAPAPAPAASAVQPPAWRRTATPLLLRAAMVLTCVPIAVFALAVHLGVARDESAVETVGRDATGGITAAQEIKSNLAALDGIVVEDLLESAPLASSGYPDDYDAMRRELDETLVAAASEAPPGPAYEQPLVNIDYALGHYHALLRDSFAAGAGGETAQAAALYAQAHDVMDGTLLPQADFFDKANTYVLNNAYDRHKADSASTGLVIFAAWLVLMVVIIAMQVLVAWKFRRMVNVALAAATVIGLASGIFALAQLDSSSSSLSAAREHAFDPVHQLARARATVVSARQAQGLWLLDPSDAAPAQADFTTEAGRLFRVRAGSDLMSTAQAGEVPDGAGGYLATVLRTAVSEDGDEAARDSLVAFGDFLDDDKVLRGLVASGDGAAAEALFRGGRAFAELTDALDHAQAVDQRTFDAHVAAAVAATRHVDVVNLVAAAAMAALAVLGLYVRLREYRH